MSQDCIDCKRSTTFGSGLFVDRVPAEDGYRCRECSMIECEDCGQMVLDDYEIIDGIFTCLDCIGEVE